jgi:glycosyltransferase involved in cell wall biosynthesis
MTTIVMAAHNEAAVIGRTLDALLDDPDGEPDLEVIVVPNGCADDTAEVARLRGVRVVAVTTAGKASALNAGESFATSFPRIYLDADVIVPAGGIRRVVQALETSGALVAIPGRSLALAGRPWPVRAYFTINERLPVFRHGLFGRGLVALSEEGRSRFTTFPPVVADDLFLDSLFTVAERTLVPGVQVRVETPYTTHALVEVLARVRRGNAALRTLAAHHSIGGVVRPAERWSWLRNVVLPNPTLAPAALVYVALSIWAALAARRHPRLSSAWGRDDTTREARAQTSPARPARSKER